MRRITKAEAIAELAKYGTAVHCELCRSYIWWYGEDSSGKFYYDDEHKCVTVEDEYDYDGKRTAFYNIHQISPDSDVFTAAEKCRAMLDEKLAGYEKTSRWLTVCHVSNGDLPEHLDRYYGWRNYARMGEAVQPDSRVRELNADDRELIKSACAPYLSNDTDFGKKLAHDFSEHTFNSPFDKVHRVFGMFDGDSALGFASSTYIPELDIAWLLDIYVLPPYRRQGLGRVLVTTALADYPDKKWHYQVAKGNVPSIALARSLGFTLEGAGLFL